MSSHANGVIRPVFEDCGISIVVKDFPDKDNLQGAYHKMIFLKRFRKKVFEMINFRYYFEGLKCIILKMISIISPKIL